MQTLQNTVGTSVSRRASLCRAAANLLVLLVVVSLPAGSARAASIAFEGIAVDNGVPDSAAPPATQGKLGTDGYQFYGTSLTTNGSPNPGGSTIATANPSYISSIATSGSFYAGNGGYTTLTIGGTPYGTGLLYDTTPQTLVTITLSGTNPLPAAGFQLAVLEQNVDAGGQGASITVSGANSVTQLTTATTNVNGYYIFDVTGLNPNDTITIAATPGVNSGTIGGVAFATITPEPSTGILALLGALGLLAAVRKRLSA